MLKYSKQAKKCIATYTLPIQNIYNHSGLIIIDAMCTTMSFDYLDFWLNIYLILVPSLWNLTTHIATLCTAMLSINVWPLSGHGTKVIFPKYSIHWTYLMETTMSWSCSKISNHDLKHGYCFKFFWCTYSVDCQWCLELIHTLLLSRPLPSIKG